METKWLRPVPLRARTEGKGSKQVDVIETEIDGVRLDFYLDPKTRLPIKIVTPWWSIYQGGGMNTTILMTVHLLHYKVFNGVQMPQTVVRDLDDPSLRISRRDTDVASYRFNVNYNQAIFDVPFPTKVNRDDWKPK